jgi:hypothetical protein
MKYIQSIYRVPSQESEVNDRVDNKLKASFNAGALSLMMEIQIKL